MGRAHQDLLGRPDPLGWYPLRHAISPHLSVWRKLDCRPEQVVITSGAAEAFEIIFRGLLGPGQTAAVEDLGWPTMRDVLGSVGAQVHPVRIDYHGLDPAQISGAASVAIVTPSRHYPTGISMPVSRRMRRTYAKRQTRLISALSHCADLLDISPDPPQCLILGFAAFDEAALSAAADRLRHLLWRLV